MTIANWFLAWFFGSPTGGPTGDSYMLFEDSDRIALEDGGGFLKLE